MGIHGLLLLVTSLLGAPLESCPVTPAPEASFVPPSPQPERAPYGASWYGTERLWTMLPRSGVLGRRNKVFWWSTDWDSRHDHRPELTVTARRVDGQPVRASRATNAHAADIGHAMLVGLTFPAAGCWEVTGEYKGATLTFVAWVP